MAGKDHGLICFHPMAQSSSAHCKIGMAQDHFRWRSLDAMKSSSAAERARGEVGLGSTQALRQAPIKSQPFLRVPSTLQCCRRGAAPSQGSAAPLPTRRGAFCIPGASRYQGTIHMPSPGFSSLLSMAEARHPPSTPACWAVASDAAASRTHSRCLLTLLPPRSHPGSQWK